MTQEQRRITLIEYLLDENEEYKNLIIPGDEKKQKILLRSLMNVRKPLPVSDEFLKIQDEYLKEAISQKGITSLNDLEQIEKDIYLWQGDITTLRCDAIVNAANSALLGCFYSCHGCIDNAIHTYAGVQLRLECNKIMEAQNAPEAAGGAKITKAFNLPCKFVLHTVGPIITSFVTKKDVTLLESCYRSCLTLAEQNAVKSIAFCCISTGEFHFPNQAAAKIAVETVREFKQKTNSEMKVIFNVFKDKDRKIYEKILG